MGIQLVIEDSDYLNFLRYVDSEDESVLEGMSDYKLDVLSDELEKANCILVAWCEGHHFRDADACRLLPRGKLFLEQLEAKKKAEETGNVSRKGETYAFGKNVVPPPPQNVPTEFEKLKAEWNRGMANRFLMKLKEKGIVTPNGDVYDWKIDNDSGYRYNLYVYFVWRASEKLGWRDGKKNDRAPWRKFNPMFPNVSGNRGTLNDALGTIRKNESLPTLASKIDEVLGS